MTTTAVRPESIAARGIKLIALQHPEFVQNPEWAPGSDQKRWIRSKGASLKEGNYTLRYGDRSGRPFTTLAGAPLRLAPLASSEKLVLQLGDARYRVDVSQVPNGAGIGEARLHKLLDCVSMMRAWGRTLACRLVLRRNDTDVMASDPAFVKTPVAPWDHPLDPEFFAQDPTIRYCGDPETKTFKGRILMRYAGRLFFTFKENLETDVEMRGFACIGLVGNLYRVPPGNAYSKGEEMAAALKGADVVTKDKEQLLRFMQSVEAKASTYMIWTGGHAGLIRNGVLYECKPPGKGFTLDSYTPGIQSAVRRYDAAQLPAQLRKGSYFLCRLPD
jgi:hypothetical protein